MLVKGINEYRKQVIDEDGCVEALNELVRVEITDLTEPQIKPSVIGTLRAFFLRGSEANRKKSSMICRIVLDFFEIV